jgi:hypothetical protein
MKVNAGTSDPQEVRKISRHLVKVVRSRRGLGQSFE